MISDQYALFGQLCTLCVQLLNKEGKPVVVRVTDLGEQLCRDSYGNVCLGLVTRYVYRDRFIESAVDRFLLEPLTPADARQFRWKFAAAELEALGLEAGDLPGAPKVEDVVSVPPGMAIPTGDYVIA